MVVSSDTPRTFAATLVQWPGFGLVAEDDAIHENAGFLGIARLVEHGRIAVRIHAEVDHQGSIPPSSTMRSGPEPSGHVRAISVHHQ